MMPSCAGPFPAVRGLRDELFLVLLVSSQREVAEFMKVPVTTVKKRLYEARKRMKASMSYTQED